MKRMGSLGQIIGDPSSTTGETTSYEDLLARRGAPWTFDPVTLLADFSRAKAKGEGSLPVYSREISDPVPDGVVLKKSHELVLCEGNYLCAFDDAMWSPLE